MHVQQFCGNAAQALRDAIMHIPAHTMQGQAVIARCNMEAEKLETIANSTNIVQGLKDAGIKL